MFPVECKDYCMFGMLLKNFDTSSTRNHAILNPEAVVRFCVKDGRMLIVDLLLASYSPKHHKSATLKIRQFMRDDRDTVRGLGLTSSNKLDALVRVVSTVL